MNIREGLGWIYYIYPYIAPIQNKKSVLLSILFSKPIHKIKLIDGGVLEIDSKYIYFIYCLLAALCFSTSYKVKSNSEIEICQDFNSTFTIHLNNLNPENANLLELLFLGSRFGGHFISGRPTPSNPVREKTFFIYKIDERQIIESSNGIRFYLDRMNAADTIIETFITNLHHINSKINWKDKVVIDVGPEYGDTPLYFASLGAKVFAFEAQKKHYDGMLENLNLNPELSKNIIPINAAIGKDGVFDFISQDELVASTAGSIVYDSINKVKNAKKVQVKSYSIESAMKKFEIIHVDLLKMDCKGCEFFLNSTSLSNIDSVKIEHLAKNEFKLEDLIKILKQSKFQSYVYRQNLQARRSNRIVGYTYATKLKN